MGRRRGLMSEQFKYELAKDLGFYDTVMREGWEGIRTKDAGNLVKRAIQIAEQKLAQEYRQQSGGAQTYGFTAQQTQVPQQQGYGMPAPQPYAQQQPAYGAVARQTQAVPPQFVNPSASQAYSRTSGFTPMYPSYYGSPPQSAQQSADGSQSFPG